MDFSSKMCSEWEFRGVVEDAGTGEHALVGRGCGAAFPRCVEPGPRMGSGGGFEAGLGQGRDAARPGWNFRWCCGHPRRGGGGEQGCDGGGVGGCVCREGHREQRCCPPGARGLAQDGALGWVGSLQDPCGGPVACARSLRCRADRALVIGSRPALMMDAGSACPSPHARFSWQSGVNALQFTLVGGAETRPHDL